MKRGALALTFLLGAFVQEGFACAIGPSFARFEFNVGDREGRYKGAESLRFFIGEIQYFNSDAPQPFANIHVLRDYGATESASTLVETLPRFATMKVGTLLPCMGYDLKKGDVGVFASFIKNGQLHLAYYITHGF